MDPESSELELEPGEELRNPVTGKPVTDPLEKLAILEGAWFEGYGKSFHVDFQKMVRPRLIVRALPRYFGLTVEEVQTWNKTLDDTLISIYELPAIFAMPMAWCAALLLRYHVPVYRMSRKMWVFQGDIVRLLESFRIDFEEDHGVVGEWFLRWARGYDTRQARQKRLPASNVGPAEGTPRISDGVGEQTPGRERRQIDGVDGQPGDQREVRRESAWGGGDETARQDHPDQDLPAGVDPELDADSFPSGHPDEGDEQGGGAAGGAAGAASTAAGPDDRRVATDATDAAGVPADERFDRGQREQARAFYEEWKQRTR